MNSNMNEFMIFLKEEMERRKKTVENFRYKPDKRDLRYLSMVPTLEELNKVIKEAIYYGILVQIELGRAASYGLTGIGLI